MRTKTIQVLRRTKNITQGYLFAFLHLVFFLFSSSAFSQQTQHQKMELLEFMVGEWIGTTVVYDEGFVSKKGAAFQNIKYDLDKTILVIELNTSLLQLHTIINYDDIEQTFYYYPFSKKGMSKYPARFDNGRFIVSPSDHRRFVFTKTSEGGFKEYGEELIDGKWEIYFEDTFINSQ